jgi:translation initiation factor IF-3
MVKKTNAYQKPHFRVNDEIKAYQVRIVGENVESKIVPLAEAKRIADDMDLDLVEINSNNGSVPIVKVVSYDKMLYELKKATKKNKQHGVKLKEIQLRVNIASHDLETKANQAKKFIDNGDKVKVILTMRGRELTRREENKKAILEFITLLDGVALPESMPKDEGNRTIVILKKKGN